MVEVMGFFYVLCKEVGNVNSIPRENLIPKSYFMKSKVFRKVYYLSFKSYWMTDIHIGGRMQWSPTAMPDKICKIQGCPGTRLENPKYPNL